MTCGVLKNYVSSNRGNDKYDNTVSTKSPTNSIGNEKKKLTDHHRNRTSYKRGGFSFHKIPPGLNM